jgi:integrase/recombinase XerD
MTKLTVVEPQPPSTVMRLVEDYLASRRAEGLSRKTVSNYDLALRRVLLPWMGRQDLQSIEALTSRHLDQLATELLDQGGARGELSRSSAWTYIRNIKLFLEWARKQGEAVNAEAKLPKLPRRLVEILEREEIQRIEDAATTERDKLIVRILADTGLRVGELVKLRSHDVIDQNKRPYVKVRGKGSRDRLVGLQPALARRLRRYIDRQRPEDADSDRLFVSQRRDRRTGRHEPLTESGVQQMIRELGHRAGITKRVHPHVFRHSAATFMLRRGVNPLLVAKILGHESLAMITRTYSHLTVEDTHEALMAALRLD